jgi:hypothetical protein
VASEVSGLDLTSATHDRQPPSGNDRDRPLTPWNDTCGSVGATPAEPGAGDWTWTAGTVDVVSLPGDPGAVRFSWPTTVKTGVCGPTRYSDIKAGCSAGCGPKRRTAST